MESRVNSDHYHAELRVLVVDDDPDSCNLMKLALEMYGIEAYPTTSAQQALESFIRLKPDVVISDIAMPDEDGYSLIRRIRALEAKHSHFTPAIAVTALLENTQEVLANGFHYMLSKPVNIDELINIVLSLAEQLKFMP